MKNIKLVWNVLLHDFNSGEIISYNVLDDDYIITTMKKLIKSGEIFTIGELKEFLCKKFRARYMSRAEYEIMVSGLFDIENAKKLDVWRQLEMNMDSITDYVIYKLDLNLKNK